MLKAEGYNGKIKVIDLSIKKYFDQTFEFVSKQDILL